MHDDAVTEMDQEMPEAGLTGLIRPAAPFVFPKWRAVRDQVIGMLLAGQTRLVVLGVAGSGKTTMLEELARLLRLAGCDTVMATGAVPAEPPTGPKPVVYVVDDADRLDRDGVAALLARPRCTVLLAGLPTFQAQWGAVPHVVLDVLTPDEGAAFVRQYLGQAGQDPALLTNAAVSRLATLSGGVLRELSGLITGVLWLGGRPPVSELQIDEVAAFRRSIAAEPGAADPPEPTPPPPGPVNEVPVTLAEVAMRRHTGALAVPDGRAAPAPDAAPGPVPAPAAPPMAVVAASPPAEAAPRGRGRVVLAGALAAAVLGAAGGLAALRSGLLDSVVRRPAPRVVLAEAVPPAPAPAPAPASAAAAALTPEHAPAPELVRLPEPAQLPDPEPVPMLASPTLSEADEVQPTPVPPAIEAESEPTANVPPEPSLEDAVTSVPDPPAITAAELALPTIQPVVSTPPVPVPAEAVPEQAPELVPKPVLEVTPEAPPDVTPEAVPAPAEPVVAALPKPPFPPVAGPPPIPRAKPVRARLPAETVRLLVDRGAKLTAEGDLSGARLLYMRAADGGSAAAALALGRLYDPSVLVEMGASLAGDPARAADWYRRAIELDDSEAAALLRRLEARTR